MASHVHDISVDYTKIYFFVFVFPSRRRQKSSHVLGTCIVLIGLFSFQIFQLPILKKCFAFLFGGGGFAKLLDYCVHVTFAPKQTCLYVSTVRSMASLRLRGVSFSSLIWPMLLEGFVGDLPGFF